MVKNAHFSRHFGENCKKTTRKRSFFFKLNNFLRILYVDQHIFTTLIDLRCFPLFLNKFLSRISRKKTFSRQKSYFFGKNCEKTTPKRSSMLSSMFSPLWWVWSVFRFFCTNSTKCAVYEAKNLLFWQKLWKNDAKKQFFFQIKNFLAHFLWFLLCFYHFEWSEVKKLSTRNAKKLSTHDPRT